MGYSQTRNGFDISNSIIPITEILSGGPPRDGIPSIDAPKFIPANQVDYLEDGDLVLGLVQNGRARAYPLRILVWHEIVNDSFAGVPVVVTYCPLCGTGIVFNRSVGGEVRTFGVSGLLYQSDVLMYDRESESLWSQLAMKSVGGPQVGRELKWLPSQYMTWKAWRTKYPDSEILSTDTGFKRDYGGQAYTSYFASEDTMFPVKQTRDELAKKAWVIGVVIDGKAKAYPVNALTSDVLIKDVVGERSVLLRYDVESQYPVVTTPEGEVIPSVTVFWFAWQAFYPATELWSE